MSHFLTYFSMGKYGFFVWSSYLISFLIMIGFFIGSRQKMQSAIVFVARYLRRKGQ